MKAYPLPRSAGFVLPSLAGSVLIWLPALLAKAAFTGDDGRPPIELFTLLMPLVTWLLWRVFLADCRQIAQRVVIPALTLLVVWGLGPLALFPNAPVFPLFQNPIAFLMYPLSVAGYSGALFGLAGVVGVVLVALVRGAAPTPPDADAGQTRINAG
ncbi:MAG: hypothetical protein DHS20C15_13640 [Planctomycetota bacterium]|nr:MAG: hypothetical protein DHS20C15_13640 [Planctomycetota bacterium]